MKYKCLVLDHDDTVVDSTATVHFPCFIEYLSKFKPGMEKDYTLTSYFEKNFHPGVVALFRDEIGMTEEEFLTEQHYWENYVDGHIPEVYPGMKEIMERFRNEGGILAVDSHSVSSYIRRDYIENGLPMPDVIYGWDMPPEERKPSPHTLFDLMRKFGLSPDEILVVDDSKPGYDMARAAGVKFAAAGWGFDVPVIEKFMRENCDFYCKTVEELNAVLFSD
ncbi:MAG: HAD-IA family hydrolase [Clostridia bacterium]|nr:HAD-IA family hydrolase [Clostridia bacterium]